MNKDIGTAIGDEILRGCMPWFIAIAVVMVGIGCVIGWLTWG